ncbi:MAG TPA: hypothetical protein VFP72_22385 [Kineosporiaceae bacterium]|nr:hypothetical protein [Kineosporiaceae bacterium]
MPQPRLAPVDSRSPARPSVLRTVITWPQQSPYTRPAATGSVPADHPRPAAPAWLVRTDSPGVLLVRLRAAGLHVAVEGPASQGWLRVHTADPQRLGPLAAEAEALILELHPR